MSGNSKGKQTTLLQTWGYEGNIHQSQKPSTSSSKATIEEAFQNDDIDDALLANAEEEGVSISNQTNFEELPPIPKSQPSEILTGFDIVLGRLDVFYIISGQFYTIIPFISRANR